jgi:hypothetical protein
VVQRLEVFGVLAGCHEHRPVLRFDPSGTGDELCLEGIEAFELPVHHRNVLGGSELDGVAGMVRLDDPVEVRLELLAGLGELAARDWVRVLGVTAMFGGVTRRALFAGLSAGPLDAFALRRCAIICASVILFFLPGPRGFMSPCSSPTPSTAISDPPQVREDGFLPTPLEAWGRS